MSDNRPDVPLSDPGEPRKELQFSPRQYGVLNELYDRLDLLDDQRLRLVQQIRRERRALQHILGLQFDPP